MKDRDEAAKEFFNSIGDAVAVQFQTSPRSCFEAGWDAHAKSLAVSQKLPNNCDTSGEEVAIRYGEGIGIRESQCSLNADYKSNPRIIAEDGFLAGFDLAIEMLRSAKWKDVNELTDAYDGFTPETAADWLESKKRKVT